MPGGESRGDLADVAKTDQAERAAVQLDQTRRILEAEISGPGGPGGRRQHLGDSKHQGHRVLGHGPCIGAGRVHHCDTMLGLPC
jgi:hypothetical protein